MAEFANRVAIVTGGAKGIGRGICMAFAREGARVLCADIDVAAGEEICGEARGLEGEIYFQNADVSQGEACRELAAAAVEKWGRIDVLCNNVGIQPVDTYLPAHQLPEEAWDQIIGVNLRSYFLMVKYCVPAMQRSGGGVIVNTASVQGLQSAPGVSAYAASKGGILSLTRQLALEYARDGIRVLAVNPGSIDTPMVDEVVEKMDLDKEALLAEIPKAHPLGRIGQPEDIAEVVLFLASDRASFMTGEYVNVDGGSMAKGSWADLEA